MAEIPAPTPEPPLSALVPTPAVPDTLHSTQYWCYQCDKLVAVESRLDQPDVICSECKNGFLEFISGRPAYPRDAIDDEPPTLSHHIVQFLRAIANPEDNDDHLRVELDGSDEINDTNHEIEDDEDRNQGNRDRDGSDDGNEENDDDEGSRRRQSRQMLRHSLHDYGLPAGRGDRILDWAELLLQLEDQSIQFGLQPLEFDDDYFDASGSNALSQDLAGIAIVGRRGSPAAAKWAVERLQIVEVNAADNEDFCAVCKDGLFTNNSNNQKIVKKLPCGHMYHGDCIVPWLNLRNSCPVCRYELPTDDHEVEEPRRNRSMAMAATSNRGFSSWSGNPV